MSAPPSRGTAPSAARQGLPAVPTRQARGGLPTVPTRQGAPLARGPPPGRSGPGRGAPIAKRPDHFARDASLSFLLTSLDNVNLDGTQAPADQSSAAASADGEFSSYDELMQAIGSSYGKTDQLPTKAAAAAPLKPDPLVAKAVDDDESDSFFQESFLMETGIVIPRPEDQVLIPRETAEDDEDESFRSNKVKPATRPAVYHPSEDKDYQKSLRQKQQEQKKREKKAQALPAKEQELQRLRALGIEQQFHVSNATVASVLVEGSLWKKGGNRKNWKQRCFTLVARALQYFAAASDNTPLGVIPIGANTVVQIGEVSKNRYLFDVDPRANSNDKQRVFHLAADSEDERQKWVVAIEAEIESLRSMDTAGRSRRGVHTMDAPPTIVDALIEKKTLQKEFVLFEGPMEKKGANRKNWKSRYFYLLPGQLHYFDSAAATSALGIIPLLNVKISVEVSSSDRKFQLSLFCPLQSRTYYFSAPQDQLQEWLEWMTNASVSCGEQELQEELLRRALPSNLSAKPRLIRGGLPRPASVGRASFAEGEVSGDEPVLRVEIVFPNSPASATGLVSGDLIMRVTTGTETLLDRESCLDMSPQERVAVLREIAESVHKTGGWIEMEIGKAVGPNIRSTRITLTPAPFDGPGLIGCKFIDADPGEQSQGATFPASQKRAPVPPPRRPNRPESLTDAPPPPLRPSRPDAL